MLFLVFVVAIPTFVLIYKPPTCFDGKMNGDEAGIDCGGSCQLLCTARSLPLVSRGDPKVLKIAEEIFSAVALVENPNTSGEIYKASYIFKIYDDSLSSIPIKEIKGETFVPKSSTFAIYEGPFSLGEGASPSRATLEWVEESFVWQRNEKQVLELSISGPSLTREDTSPRLDADIENMSLERVSHIDLVALIYDETGSIFAASKTFVDSLDVGESAPIVFTWPRPFEKQAYNVDIIVRIFPDRSFIQ